MPRPSALPVVWTAPFTLRIDLARDEKYKFYEYACHEGDEQVRNYIVTSRIKRAQDKAAVEKKLEATYALTQPMADNSDIVTESSLIPC